MGGTMSAMMTRRNVFLPDPLWEAAQRIAEQDSQEQGRGVSAADIVREALERYVKTRGRKARTR
jgi:hypothetical protein